MRKGTLILAAVVLAGLLSGCGGNAPASSTSSAAAASEPEPLHLEELNLELYKEEGSEEALMAALQQLPGRLQTALAEYGVEADTVHVTVGTSGSATCGALAAGSVDAAFLPADVFAACSGGTAILADTWANPGPDSEDPADWNGSYEGIQWTNGTRALLCASGTEYGRNLAARTGGTWSWEELNRAHWGVLGEASLAGNQCLELWLEDHYEGNGIADLSNVTVYDSAEDLIQAAHRGEIDAFPFSADQRGEYQDQWSSIFDDTQVLALTDPLYSYVAAVTPKREELRGADFAAALSSAVLQICGEDSRMTAVFGTDGFAAVEDSALDGMRRLQPAKG